MTEPRTDGGNATQNTGNPVEILLAEDNPNDVRMTKRAFEKGKFLNNIHVAEVADEHEPVVERMRQTAEHIQELTENSGAYIEAVTGDGEMETQPTRVDWMLREELEKARSRHGDATFVEDRPDGEQGAVFVVELPYSSAETETATMND